jgi:hypothetical protein
MRGSVSTGSRSAQAATVIEPSLPHFMLQCNNYLLGINNDEVRCER